MNLKTVKHKILIADDDKAVRTSFSVMLRHSGYEVLTASTPDEAIEAVRRESPSLILMDMNYSGGTSGDEGIELLRKVKVLSPSTPVVLMTAWGSIPLAVEGMKHGAFDFLTKPCNGLVLTQRIATALAVNGKETAVEPAEFDRSFIVGRSRRLTEILDIVRRIAPTDASVLITGENGTGKELIARAVHVNSRRAAAPFVMVNLGGIPQSLFESEMFGHAKGAFTGAVAARKGRFEMADGGTIFLDEIGDLDLNCQVKMLRVLQQHTFEPLGDSRQRTVDLRVVAATNADLPAMLRDHTFREDLYYRLNSIVLHLPPLRERREDIPLLVDHFASAMQLDYKPEFTSEAITLLTRLPYPGNIRELKNVVERAVLVCGPQPVGKADIELADSLGLQQAPSAHLTGLTLEEMERQAVVAALDKHSGNITNAAIELGITRQSLYRKMEKHGIKP